MTINEDDDEEDDDDEGRKKKVEQKQLSLSKRSNSQTVTHVLLLLYESQLTR